LHFANDVKRVEEFEIAEEVKHADEVYDAVGMGSAVKVQCSEDIEIKGDEQRKQGIKQVQQIDYRQTVAIGPKTDLLVGVTCFSNAGSVGRHFFHFTMKLCHLNNRCGW
jgi:hypothetical protein